MVGRSDNFRFSVALDETDLNDYNATLCYSYPGPPMVDSQQEWMNCTSPMRGQFVQIIFVQPRAQNTVNFAELDVYGF